MVSRRLTVVQIAAQVAGAVGGSAMVVYGLYLILPGLAWIATGSALVYAATWLLDDGEAR